MLGEGHSGISSNKLTFLMNLNKIPKVPGLNFPWKISGKLPEHFQPFETISITIIASIADVF
jgi:hypothetical protein